MLYTKMYKNNTKNNDYTRCEFIYIKFESLISPNQSAENIYKN